MEKYDAVIVGAGVSDPKLKNYYSKYKIIKKVYWNTAVVFSGKTWVDQNLDKNLYLASDYNIC